MVQNRPVHFLFPEKIKYDLDNDIYGVKGDPKVKE